MKSDEDVLKSNFLFVRNDDDDRCNLDNWEIRLSKQYYDRLYKEFALIDLGEYKKGFFGMRWRIQNEVVQGKGETICGSIDCQEKFKLHSYEVPFQYYENSIQKAELVKVRLCSSCATKLMYHQRKKENISSKGKVTVSVTKKRKSLQLNDDDNEVELIPTVTTPKKILDLTDSHVES